MLAETVKVETQIGDPIQAHGMRLHPVAKSVRILPPNGRGGLIWNRASAVLVEADGQTYLLPVRDVTRRAQLLLRGIGLVGSLLAWLALRTKD